MGHQQRIFRLFYHCQRFLWRRQKFFRITSWNTVVIQKCENTIAILLNSVIIMLTHRIRIRISFIWSTVENSVDITIRYNSATAASQWKWVLLCNQEQSVLERKPNGSTTASTGVSAEVNTNCGWKAARKRGHYARSGDVRVQTRPLKDNL